MNAESSESGRFEPLHDAHAIEQLAMGIVLDAPVSEEGMQAAVKAIHTNFSSDLPGSADLQTLTLAFGVSLGAASPPRSTAYGRMFTHTQPNGAIERELRLEPASVTFRTTAYTRWPKVWDEAERYFRTVLPLYIQNANIAALTLNFVDKFHWLGDVRQCRIDRLLRAGSRYVCPHVYSADDLWHSYTGCFIRASSQVKRLLNLNVDFLEQNQVDGPRRVVQIATLLTDRLNQPGYERLEKVAGEEALKFVARNLNDLHAFSKQVFGEVINDRMARRIALTE